MNAVLNTIDYPIIVDGDDNAIASRQYAASAAVCLIFSEDASGRREYVGTVTEGSAFTRGGMARYAYTGYGFPESVETESALSINKIVALSVREWGEMSARYYALV